MQHHVALAAATAISALACLAAAIEPVAVYPSKISAKYAKEIEGKAIAHTCWDQYKANRPTSDNGGLGWIQNGGGYYPTCAKRLGGR